MLLTKLYVYVPKGTKFKPGSLVGECGVRADYIALPDGSAFGCFLATSAQARQKMEAVNGVTVLPPIHLPLKPNHVSLFGPICGAVQGDTTYDLGIKAWTTFAMPWFHPENGLD